MVSLNDMLEPGETVRFRPGGGVFDSLRLLLVLIVNLVASGIVGLMVRQYLHESGSDLAAWPVAVGAGLCTFALLYLVWKGMLEPKPGSFLLTDRRVLLSAPGFWSGRIETLALSDIAEIRRGLLGITLIATSRDAVRRLQRDGSTEPAGDDRLCLPLLRFRFPGVSESKYDRAVRLLGREPAGATP